MKSYFDNLRPFEKRVVFGVGALLFLVVNFWFVFPRFSDWGAMQARRGELEQKLARYNDLLGQEPALQRQIKQLESESLDVPEEEQSLQFSRTIQQQQVASGVSISTAGISSSRTNQFFLEMSTVVGLTSTEKQIVDFLYSLGAGSSLIRVRDLTIRPDAPRHVLNSSVKLVASFKKKAAKPAATGTRPAATPSPRTAQRP